MARGTKAGLLEEGRHAQSVYKLAILRQYMPKFVAMTGSGWSSVVLVDGFAGTGQIGSQPGSAKLMASTAARLRNKANVTVHLCERDPANYAALSDMAAGFTERGLKVQVKKGDVAQYLPGIVDASVGSPLFLFLDPCGALLPFDAIAAPLVDPRRARLPTEGLLNFSSDLVRRVGGDLVKRRGDAQGVARLNAVCGGDWWQSIAQDLGPQGGAEDYGSVVDAVAAGYARRLEEATKKQVVMLPVRRKVTHQPIYHLIFATRNEHGLAAFADAVARARPEWLAAIPDPDAPAELDLFGSRGGESATASEAQRSQALSEQHAAGAVVLANLRTLTSGVARFVPLKHVSTIYGSALGVATDTQIAQSLRIMVASGEIAVEQDHPRPMRRTYRVLRSQP